MENRTKTILLVEDDKALNRAVTFKLEQKGHIVISTFDAEAAFEALKNRPEIELIWLVIRLPGMDGLSFLSEIRKRPEGKDKKVVICSVSGGANAEQVGKSLGIVDYLVKSDYDLDTLVDKVVDYV